MISSVLLFQPSIMRVGVFENPGLLAFQSADFLPEEHLMLKVDQTKRWRLVVPSDALRLSSDSRFRRLLEPCEASSAARPHQVSPMRNFTSEPTIDNIFELLNIWN